MKSAIPAISIISFAGLLLVACQSKMTKQKITPQIEYTNVEVAGSFNVPLKGTTVIRSEPEWNEWREKYWNRFSGSGNKTPPTAIDFESRMVIVLH